VNFRGGKNIGQRGGERGLEKRRNAKNSGETAVCRQYTEKPKRKGKSDPITECKSGKRFRLSEEKSFRRFLEKKEFC